MAALVLVDLDNVLGEWGRAQKRPIPRTEFMRERLTGQLAWLQADDGAPANAADANCARAVVVIGLNTATATFCNGGLTFDWVLRFGERLARGLGLMGPVAVEIALTLPAPQSVDVALCRLAQNTAIRENDGRFEDVWLFSRDLGLRKSIRELAFQGAAWVEVGRPFLSWKARTRLPIHRGYSPPPVPPEGACPQAPAHAWSACINTVGEREWAGRRNPDVAADWDLPELASAARKAPSLITQIGVTQTMTTSLRGVVRIEALARSCHPKLGFSMPGELEVHHPEPGGPAPPLRKDVTVPGSQLGASAVGNGAVHMKAYRATAGTRLPLDFLKKAGIVEARFDGAPAPWGECTVRDDKAIRRIFEDRTAMDASVVVSFVGHPHFKAEIDSRPGQPPKAWWFGRVDDRGGSKAKTEVNLLERPPNAPPAGAPPPEVPLAIRFLLPHDILGLRCSFGVSHDGDVLFMAPSTPSNVAQIETAVDGGRIVEAYIGKTRVALLNPSGLLAAGMHRCTPIQHFSHVDLASQYPMFSPEAWRRLALMPLVLPLEIEQ